MKKKGILIVVSGFSGAGKGTLMRRLLELHKDNYALSVSATTRAPREGERDGQEYFFVNTARFEDMIAQGALIEYAKYVKHYYGTPKDYVEQRLLEGKDVILEIEMQGALKVKECYPDTLLLFVTPPSIAELKRRLTNRGTEDEETIRSRLRQAALEIKGVRSYDYIVVNDDIETCVKELHGIVQNERFKVSRSLALISALERELL